MKKFSVHNSWSRNKQNIIGFALCIFLFLIAFIINGNTGLYLNISGFIIVFTGTIGATLLSYDVRRMVIAAKVLHAAYFKELMAPRKLIRILVELSAKKRIKGLLSLQKDEEETTIFFLRQAIGLMVDDYTEMEMKEALTMEMYFFKMRREKTRRVFKTMAELAPSFGLVGSVIGLISLLAGIGDSNIILSAIPIALTSTLYGIIFSNFFLHPFAARIREKTVQELLLQKIITQGMIEIAADIHPQALDRKLKSYLTPSERTSEPISLSQLHEKLELRENAFEPVELFDSVE